MRRRPDVGDVLSFCSGQVGFRARLRLYKICIVSNIAYCFDPYELCHPSMRFCVSGLSIDDSCDPRASNAW